MATVPNYVQTLDDLWQYMTGRFRHAEREADRTAGELLVRFDRYLPDRGKTRPTPFADLGDVFERFQVQVRVATESAQPHQSQPGDPSPEVPAAAVEHLTRHGVSGFDDLTRAFDEWGASGFLVLLGDPGVGKTWQSARLWHRATTSYLPPSGGGVLPILLTAKELVERGPVGTGRLRDLLRLPEHSTGVRVLLFVDGWDEVGEAEQLQLLPSFRGDVRDRGDVAVLLTSRPSKFHPAQFQNVLDRAVWRLTALDAHSQADGGEQLVRRWYAATPGAEARGELLARRLRESRRVREMVRVPLLTVILCRYWNTPRGGRLPDELPDSGAKLIEEFLTSLLEHQQRDNLADNITSFFGRVRTTLTAAAAGTFRGERWRVTEESLRGFGIDRDDWERLIGPLGLFTRVGVIEFEILHQVFAEWLTADGLTAGVGDAAAFRRATRPGGDGVKILPIRFLDRRWREVWKFLAQLVPDDVFEEWLQTLWAVHRRWRAGDAGAVWEPAEDVFDSAACLAGHLLAARRGGGWLSDQKNRRSVGHRLAKRLFRLWEKDRGGADVRAACVALVSVGYYRPILRPFRWRRWKSAPDAVLSHATAVFLWACRMTGVAVVFGWVFVRIGRWTYGPGRELDEMRQHARVRSARRQHPRELRDHDPRRLEDCPGVGGMLRVAELLRDGGGDAAEFVHRVLPMLDDPREKAVNAAFSTLGRVAAQAGDAAPALVERMKREYHDYEYRTVDENADQFSGPGFHGDWEKQILNVLVALGPHAAPVVQPLRAALDRDNREQKRSAFAIARVLMVAGEEADGERVLRHSFYNTWLDDSNLPDAPDHLDVGRHERVWSAVLDRAEPDLAVNDWPPEVVNAVHYLSMSSARSPAVVDRLLGIGRRLVERAGVPWRLNAEVSAEDRDRLRDLLPPHGLLGVCQRLGPTDPRFAHLWRLLVSAHDSALPAAVWRLGMGIDFRHLRRSPWRADPQVQELLRNILRRVANDGTLLAHCCAALTWLDPADELVAKLVALAEWDEWYIPSWREEKYAAAAALARFAPPQVFARLLDPDRRAREEVPDADPRFRYRLHDSDPRSPRPFRTSCRQPLARALAEVGPVDAERRAVLEPLLTPPAVPEFPPFDDDPRVSLARAIGFEHLTDEHFRRLRTPARWWHLWSHVRPKGYRRLYLDWLRHHNRTLTKTGREVNLTAG